MAIKRMYLGDSVYAEYHQEDNQVLLYTDNGKGAENKIWIEPETFESLVHFFKNVGPTHWPGL